jgi:hypothetical protein
MWQFWEQETTMVLDLRLQGCYGNSRVRVWSGSGSIEDLYMKFHQEWFNSNFYKDLIFFKRMFYVLGFGLNSFSTLGS